MTLYEGMTGVELEISILGIASLTGVEEPKLHVTEPDGEKTVWTPEVIMERGLFRYVHAAPIKAGEYSVQPSFILGNFSGPWGIITFRVEKSVLPPAPSNP